MVLRGLRKEPTQQNRQKKQKQTVLCGVWCCVGVRGASMVRLATLQDGWGHAHSKFMMIMPLACALGARCPPHGTDEQCFWQRLSCVTSCMAFLLHLPHAKPPTISRTSQQPRTHRHDELVFLSY